MPQELGLHGIKKSFNQEIESSQTKFHRGAVRSGQRIEYEGSIVVLGDVNGDGYVRMNDVMLIAKYIVESQGISSNYLKAADVTSDTNIKMNDVMKLAKYLVEGGKL